MKRLVATAAVVFLCGCSSTTTQYYEAVALTAESQANAVRARAEALSQIAASGDPGAASAAVMALALTQTQTITPVPQQSQAIQWASILAAPLSNVATMYLQNDATKAMAKYQADVSLARVAATSQSNAALYGTFADMNQATADVGIAGLGAAGNVDYTPLITPFIDGMVTLGTAGITGAVDLGTAGFGANTDIATAGIDGLVELGNAGITGVTTVSSEAFSTILDLDTGNNSLLDGLWTNYTTSIQDIIDGVPRVCQTVTDANGVTSIVCE
tara:strand:+ start:956 stop:1771 length:816 start_codon:yes stop_codon:yes gene_type:complete